MAIDLRALHEACLGDPEKKVSVNKKWLAEVYSELSELERRRHRDRKLAKQMEEHQSEIDKHFEETSHDMDRIFKRQDGLFDKIFGKGNGKGGFLSKFGK